MEIDEAVKKLNTTGLKSLGSAMVDRLEHTEKYVSKELGRSITDYLIIGKSDEEFNLNMDAILKVENQKEALVIAAVAGGMCEMSSMVVELSNEVKRRK